jgi:hypothetical protein
MVGCSTKTLLHTPLYSIEEGNSSLIQSMPRAHRKIMNNSKRRGNPTA